MSAQSFEQLLDQVRRVRAEPGIPQQVGSQLSLADIQRELEDVRASLIDAVDAAPDSAFAAQPGIGDDEQSWSVGEIVGHANGSALGIGSSAMKLLGRDMADPPASLQGVTEPRVMSRAEASAAARGMDYAALLSGLDEDANLDNSESHDFFGTMSARAWLHFIAMHEADHVNQIREMSA